MALKWPGIVEGTTKATKKFFEEIFAATEEGISEETKKREEAASLLAKHEVTAAYELALTDAGLVVEVNKATETTLTIPKHASVAFPVGTVLELSQMGVGKIQVVGATGVTLHSPSGSVKTRTQYSSVALRQRVENEWILTGDLE